MSNIEYIKLKAEDIELDLFKDFNRYQEVKKCWRKEDNNWVLKDIAFLEQWGLDEYSFLVDCLKNTVNTGGAVIGVFIDKKLVGFGSLENQFFGSENQYLQLSSIHISNEQRGRGIGKKLFLKLAEKARGKGAKKLYISAHSSEETQAFYKSFKCIEAREYNEELFNHEPYDCHLEYLL